MGDCCVTQEPRLVLGGDLEGGREASEGLCTEIQALSDGRSQHI